MKELWLNFRDPGGERRRVAVEKDRFVIGRHSETDLCVRDSNLSREHLRIERKGEDILVSDLGSSNGTTLNGEPLTGPEAIRNGDKLLLGGSLEMTTEIPADAEIGAAPPEASDPEQDVMAPEPGLPAATPAQYSQPAAASSSIPKSVFFIAPVLLVVILGLVGGLIYVIGKKQPVAASNDEFQYSNRGDDEDPPLKKKEAVETKEDRKSTDSPVSNSSSNDAAINTSNDSPSQTSPGTSASSKVEENAAAFLRKAAQNDPKAFLTTDQAKRVDAKVKQLSGSSAVADNINSARKASAQIRALASSKNLKPQLLAVAALAKLGTTRGDVLQAANNIAGVLDKLGTQIGNESGDDTLLMIAAYDQGAAGDFLKMRNMLQDLANKFPESARSIRSIWFLEKNGKLTPAEFDRALSFLAIGTISQNPKDFGVNAEALSL